MDKVKVGDLFTLEKGELQSTKNSPGRYNFITAAEKWKTHNTYTHECEALVFANAASGSLGRTHYVNGKFVASDLCFIMRPKASNRYPINLRFYYHIFNVIRKYIVAQTKSGTSKESINQKSLRSYRIPYIDIDDQNCYLDKIEYCSRISESLEKEIFLQSSLLSNLRQIVLQLSVQGKIIPQDSNDEPASELLKKIKAEKEELVANKTIKSKWKLHRKAKDEPPYYIPSTWEWVRLKDVVWCFRGHNPPKSEFVKSPRKGYVRFIQITDFKTDDNAIYVPESDKLKMVRRGEIVMAAYRHIGKVSRQMEGAFNVALCKVNEIKPMDRDFVELLIKTDLVKGELLRASERGHIPSMHSDHLLSLFIPIPPLTEQKRIVAKVDQLMMLCNKLQEQIEESRHQSEILTESVVHHLLAS